MTDVLVTVLPIAAAIAVFPIPIIASTLLVGSARGRAKGAAFTCAWAVGLGGVGAIVLVLTGADEASDEAEPAMWMRAVLLVLGIGLLVAAVRKWRGRPRAGDDVLVPAWMRSIDGFTIPRAGATGFALAGLNPKNIALTAAASAEIAAFGLPPDRQIGVLVAFVVLASVGVVAPLVLAVALGSRSAPLLERLRTWMARNNAIVMSALFALVGAKLTGDAVLGFV